MKSSGYARKTQCWRIGWIVIILMTFIASCAPTRTIVRTEYVYILPPEQYLQSYTEPDLAGPTHGDLVNWIMDLRETNRLHESDKRALREWAGEVAQ